MSGPRVLVVDDSAFARTVLGRLMRASGQIEVVGTARDGADALEKIAALDPDVVTLDLTMPSLDGIGVLRALAGRPRPRVIVVSISTVDTEIGAEALALGAVDLVTKPTALASDRLNDLGDELIAKVVALGAPIVAAPVTSATRGGAAQLIAIGTSTGGPQALTRLMATLPADLAAPIAMVLHIPAGYTRPLAERLDKLSKLEVLEAEDGLALVPGRAILARGGMHLRVERSGAGLVARLATSPPRQFMPSVDELFTSAAAATGRHTLGVVLTGMGDDGLAGSRVIHSVGGSLITESAASCVVYGMPRAVAEANLGASSVALDAIAEELLHRV